MAPDGGRSEPEVFAQFGGTDRPLVEDRMQNPIAGAFFGVGRHPGHGRRGVRVGRSQLR